MDEATLALPWWLIATLSVAAGGLLAYILLTNVYKHIVCLRYLFSGWKAIVPIVSSLPAFLGVFLLIVVFTIMNGFTEATQTATRGTLSDVIVDAGLTGMPRYDELKRRLEALDEVEAATPVISSWGVVRMGGEDAALVRFCRLIGVRPEGKARMGRFLQYIHILKESGVGDVERPEDLAPSDVFELPPRVEAMRGELDMRDRPACIPGMALVSGARETRATETVPAKLWPRIVVTAAAGLMVLVTLVVWRASWRAWPALGCGGLALALVLAAVALHLVYRGDVVEIERKKVVEVPQAGPYRDLVVTTVPIRRSGAVATEAGGTVRAQSRALTPIYAFRSRYYEADSRYLYVPFELAQEMTGLAAVPAEDTPARTTHMEVKAAPGANLERVRELVQEVAIDLARGTGSFPLIQVQTWQHHVGPILNVVKMERNLVAFMLGLMFVGFAILVALISYVMVYIKQRDVGIMKALGASDAGVGALFLSYGFVIGLLGTAAGVAGALAMIHYLDQVEAVLNVLLGIEIFPREIYYFERIPRSLSPAWVVVVSLAVLVLSTLASAVGGLLGAMRQPVEALRYE